MNKNTDKSFEKFGIIVFMLSMCASGFNYLFQILSGRCLTPDDYGLLNSLFSILNIVTVVGSAIGLSITKHIAENQSISKFQIVKILKHSLFVSIPLMIITTLMTLLIIKCDIITAIMVAVASVAISYTNIFAGILQGKKQFLQFGIYNVIQPFIKTILGTILLFLGFKYQCVFIVMILGAIIATLYAYYNIRNLLEHDNERQSDNLKSIYTYFVFTMISTACLTLFNNIDILLVKNFFPANDVGMYSSASLFGKIMLYIPSALISVMIPIVAESKTNRKKTLLKTLIYSIGISGILGVGFYLFRHFLINLLMGAKYLEATQHVLPICLMMMCLSGVSILINYLISTNQKWFVTISGILAVIAMIVTVLFFNQTINMLITCMSVVYIVLFVILLIKVFTTEDK